MKPLHEWLRERLEPKPDELVVESTGRNETFRHREGCAMPARPCGCMPTFQVKNVDGSPRVLREFWVTPHLNRRRRRQLAHWRRRGWL